MVTWEFLNHGHVIKRDSLLDLLGYILYNVDVNDRLSGCVHANENCVIPAEEISTLLRAMPWLQYQKERYAPNG